MPSDPARPLLRWQRTLVLTLVALVAVVAVVVAIAVSRAQTDRRAENLARQAADASTAVVSALTSGMSGGAALVDGDGTVDVGAFDAYALDVVDESPAQALALVAIVEDEDRPAFEQSIGVEVVDEVGGRRAASRSRYYAVARVTPTTEENAGLVGLDLGMDPVRSAAIDQALATGETTISTPIGSLPTGRPAVFLAKPLFQPAADGSPRRDQPTAVVTTGFQGARLLETITGQWPSGTRLQISDGGAVLAATDPPPDGGTEQVVSVGGHEWTVAVSPRDSVRYLAAWLVGLTGAVVVGALALVLLRGSRHERRLRRGTEALGRLADLSQELAVATDVGDLARAVGNHVPAIVGAQLAGVAVVEHGEGQVRLVPHADIPAGLAATFAVVDLDAPSAVADAARDGEVILLADPAALKADMAPEEAAALAAAGFSAAGLVPLTVQGSVRALVGVAWRSTVRVGQAEEAGLRTVSEVCTRTLERIEEAQITVDRESGLATLARRLSTAMTRDDVTQVMFTDAGSVVGASFCTVGSVEPGGALLAVADSALPTAVAERYRRLPLDAGIPLTDAVLRNQTVLVEDPDAMRSRYPGIMDDAQQLGFAALAALPLHDTAGTPMGVLGMAWNAPLRVDAALRSTLHTVADMAAQTYERVALADEHLREGELNGRLADVGERLATAASTEDVTAMLAESAADVVSARSASVGLLDTSRGLLHMVDEARVDGWTVSLADEPQDPAAQAILSRTSAVSDEAGGTTVAEPLVDHRRQVVGAITVTFAPGEAVAPSTLRAVNRLAEMAGQALERASITDAEHRRTSLLADYATRLSAAQGVDEVIEAVVSGGGLPVDADEVRVALVDEARDILVVHDAAPSETGEPDELPLGTGLDPITDAVMRREPVLVGNADEWRRHYPDRAAAASAAGLESMAALQLRWADGRPLGVVSVAWRRPTRFDDQTNATLHLIARLAAQALQRAALRDVEHQVIADLQDRLVTEVPDIPGLVVAARYRASGTGLDVGGDWFAGFPLPGGRLGLIVGDMTGHGISAVADMAQVRAMTSALLRAGLTLEDVADQASEFVAESASAVATAMVAVLDPVAATLSCIVAGQVPPMLVHADGTTEVLDGRRRPLLGVPSMSTGSLVVHRPLPPGSMLVAYTDGLVERRGELIDEGIARLRDVLRGELSAPEELADRVLAEMVGRGHEDDIALVIVQASPEPTVERADEESQAVPAEPASAVLSTPGS